MELKCLQCEHEFEGSISKDILGWHSVCPKCGGSFDVDVPKGTIVVAFADPIEGADNPNKPFEQKLPEWNIHSYYAFDSVEAFVETWQTIVEKPDGAWYWVIDNGTVLKSGPCVPEDFEIFRETWDLNEDGERNTAESSFEGFQKASREYEKFRLQWMIDHGFSLLDLMTELEKMLEEDTDGMYANTSIGNLFAEWELDHGFGDGSLWPCFDEFLCSDYPLTCKQTEGVVK